MSTISSRTQGKLSSLEMMLYDRIRLAESILAEPLGPLSGESRDPGAPWQLRYGTGATLPETLHLSIELGIKALIEAFGGPGVIKNHDLGKLLALLGRTSDKGMEAVFFLSRSFDSAVQVYGLRRGWGDLSRFESIQKYFRSTGRSEHYQAYRYNQPSISSRTDLEELVNSVWERIDLRLHLEIVRVLMYSARYFDRLLDSDATSSPPPGMLEVRMVGAYIRAFRAAALPRDGDVTPPGPIFENKHREWLRKAVRASYRGETTEDAPEERAARVLGEESKNDIALRYWLDLWRRTEPDPEDLDPSRSDGYTLSDDFDIHAYVESRSGTLLGSVRQRRDGLWDAKPTCTRQRSVLSSKEHAIRFVMKKATQSAHVFVNERPLGEVPLVRYLGSDFGHVEGYPCGWDGSRFRFEFLVPHRVAIGDDLACGLTDRVRDEGEPEGIGGHVVGTDEHVVYVKDLWGMGWDGPNLRRLYRVRFPWIGKEDEKRRD